MTVSETESSTSVLHIFGVLIGEVATPQTWLWKGLRAAGGMVTASGAVFLLQTLRATASGRWQITAAHKAMTQTVIKVPVEVTPAVG